MAPLNQTFGLFATLGKGIGDMQQIKVLSIDLRKMSSALVLVLWD